MSDVDVQLVEGMVELFNEGGVEAALQLCAEDIEWHTDPKWPADRVYRGHDGLRRLTDLWLQTFDEHRWQLERVVDREQRAVALLKLQARSKGEQEWTEQPVGLVASGRGGKVAYVQSWLSWDEALAAAGVPLE